jgi:hypothetical protein
LNKVIIDPFINSFDKHDYSNLTHVIVIFTCGSVVAVL